MTLSAAQRNASYRQRKAERLASMEAALREIVKAGDDCPIPIDSDYLSGVFDGLNTAAEIAYVALGEQS